MKEMIINANAKINLALAIRYKRQDGFHEIESIFQEIDFCDIIYLSKSDSIDFQTNSPLLSKESSNICINAAELIIKNFDIPGVSIYLEKNLPIGAGLGGGSSDAAAVLKGGVQLYNLQIAKDKLHKIAQELGSDVPFFLCGGTSYVTGRGENCQSIDLGAKYYILIVMPDIHISTAWAYKRLNLGLTKHDSNLKFVSYTLQHLSVGDFRSFFCNDFENLLFTLYAKLAEIKETLYDLGADYASLSGSGSVIFGLFQYLKDVNLAYNKLKNNYNCRICKPVFSNKII